MKRRRGCDGASHMDPCSTAAALAVFELAHSSHRPRQSSFCPRVALAVCQRDPSACKRQIGWARSRSLHRSRGCHYLLMLLEPVGASVGFDGEVAADAHTRPLRARVGRLQARGAVVSYLVEVQQLLSEDYCYSQLWLSGMISHSLESCWL